MRRSEKYHDAKRREGNNVQADIQDLSLGKQGWQRVSWAEAEMPVLRLIRERFARERPSKGIRIAACLHVTTETANLMRTLQAGGASLALCASNPLSTQDDVAAALVEHVHLPVFARRGEDRDTYYRHVDQALATRPNLTMDDGADLVSVLHSSHPELLGAVIARPDEPTTPLLPPPTIAPPR